MRRPVSKIVGFALAALLAPAGILAAAERERAPAQVFQAGR